jgi:hypothetical protein
MKKGVADYQQRSFFFLCALLCLKNAWGLFRGVSRLRLQVASTNLRNE